MGYLRRFGSCALALGLTAIAFDVSAQEVVERESGLYSTVQIERTIAPPSGQYLVVRSAESLRGELIVSTGASDEIHLSYRKQARTGSRTRAIDYIDLISVGLAVKNDRALLELRAPNPAPWETEVESGMVIADITVPPGYYVVVEATYFDVNAQGPFRGVEVENSLGRLVVDSVQGRLRLATVNRRVDISNITGDMSVSTQNSSIMARDLRADGARASFRNDGGDIKIERFRGSLNVKNRFGRIDISEFEATGGTTFIRGQSGPVILDLAGGTDGPLVVSNELEDIEITMPDTLSTVMTLAVEKDQGRIEATGFRFKTDLVRSNRLNLIAGTGTVEISGTVRGQGNIYVRGFSTE